MNRISRRIRDQAAHICAVAASGGVWHDGEVRWSQYYGRIVVELGSPSSDALALAIRAYGYVMGELGGIRSREVDAEAEAILRTGWSP